MNRKKVYIRKDSLTKLENVDAVVFDCDGVLIDIRESCNKAIPSTVAYVIKETTGLQLPENTVSREAVYLFKSTGGFNNDWDLAYAVLMFIFSRLPEEFPEVFEGHAGKHQGDPSCFLHSIKDGVERGRCLHDLESLAIKLRKELKRFAKAQDACGIASVEERLSNTLAATRFSGYYSAVKSLLSYPGGVGESFLTTVFEEIFWGSDLFRDTYEREPRFFRGQGLIENEKVIALPETLESLRSILGGANLGISSGRPLKLAKHTLKGLLNEFNQRALVFLDQVEAKENESLRFKGSSVNLKKPNPFSLLESSGALEPFKFALYVGDSTEDVIMVREANEADPRFLFAGAYDHSDCKGSLLRGFLRMESDIILPSVNELPIVLEALREGRVV